MTVEEIEGMDHHGAVDRAGDLGKDNTAMAILMAHQVDGNRKVSQGLLKHQHLVDKITVEEGRELKMAFEAFDANNSGFLELSELSPLMRSLGSDLSQDELEDYMKMIDTDRDM